ncbi:GIN domain-containing protein [Botryobacter ruber]|uniref:GIN domain-containing protein n=1 Tax=Botryobacter ruber TaxID=2171629 RepID=UPI000E0C646F|nr:DUF2807 domain-containing protein [Botryobacter ruber]
MKKNISINLQGIIFHIEEDGYEQLSTYLASVRNYFSTYEGHEEIIADIEARIAEIFAGHLSPAKQVITQEDVQKLIAQMGNVNDFEQAEPFVEEPAFHTASATGKAADPGNTSSAGYQAPETETTTGPKKLYRDFSNRIISGVAAGVANYFSIDPLWIRLLFVFLVVLAPFTAGLSVAFVLVAYIILWIALPVNYSLPESNVKKLFRDPIDKKLGGVASGIARYFGLDVTVVRVLFLASVLLGGTGLLIYIGFWIAVPEASTLTERMQMQGNPVTLSGIEQTLKENLRFKDQNGEETPVAKALLLPLRLLSQLLNWFGRVLGPLFSALISLIRIFAGVSLLAVSIALTFGLFIGLLVATGVIDEYSGFWMNDIPMSVYLGGFPESGIISGFIAGLIPLLLLFILAVSLLAKRFFLRPIAGWSMFGVWLVSVFVLIASIAMFSQNFRRSGEVELAQQLPVEGYQTLILDAYDMNREYGRVNIEPQGHTNSFVEIRQQLQAKGRTEDEAKQNARMVSYRVEQRDSVLMFDNAYKFKDGAVFRKQEVHVTLLVPESKQVRVTKDFVNLVPGSSFEGNYSREKIVRNTWQMQGSQFVCLTCSTDTLDTPTSSPEFVYQSESEATGMAGSVLMDAESYGDHMENYNFSGFNRISANGPYHLQLIQGDNYAVSARGDKDDIRKLRISKDGNELEIKSSHTIGNLFDRQNPVLIRVTVPELRALELSGAIKADVNGIRTAKFDLSMTGAIKSNINVEASTVSVEMTGASESTMTGRTENLEVEMAGASSLDAANLQATTVKTELMGACKAAVYATGSLKAEAAGASSIRYKGNPADVTTNVVGASKVDRDEQ